MRAFIGERHLFSIFMVTSFFRADCLLFTDVDINGIRRNHRCFLHSAGFVIESALGLSDRAVRDLLKLCWRMIKVS